MRLLDILQQLQTWPANQIRLSAQQKACCLPSPGWNWGCLPSYVLFFVLECQCAYVLLPVQRKQLLCNINTGLEVCLWKTRTKLCHDTSIADAHTRTCRNGVYLSICVAHTDVHMHQHTQLLTFGDCLFWLTSGGEPHLWRWLCFGSWLVTLCERRQEQCPRLELALFSPAVCPFVIGRNTRRPVAICQFE